MDIAQEQLAEKIGFDVSYLGRIELGKSANIQINILEKIIEALDEDYPTFFSFGATKNRDDIIVQGLSVSKNKDELLAIIKKIIKLEQK